MGFSSRSEYAILAVYELSRVFQSGKTVSAQKIARTYNLSSSFLIQTLRRLREAGLVDTERGAQGGYRLLSRPEDIALGYVVALVEAPSPTPAEESGQNTSQIKTTSFSPRVKKEKEFDVRNKLDEIWNQGESKRQEFFNSVTFSELTARSSDGKSASALNFNI